MHPALINHAGQHVLSLRRGYARNNCRFSLLGLFSETLPTNSVLEILVNVAFLAFVILYPPDFDRSYFTMDVLDHEPGKSLSWLPPRSSSNTQQNVLTLYSHKAGEKRSRMQNCAGRISPIEERTLFLDVKDEPLT